MDMYEKRQLIKNFMIIAIIIAIVSSWLTYFFGVKPLYEGIEKEEYSENSNENIEKISTNIKTFRQMIDRFYIGEVDEKNMLEETLKGYVNGLGDEYSSYMTSEEWEEFQSDALGNYVGIGIYMSVDKNGNVVIVSPIKGTPAEAAGLKSEDIIVEVDGEQHDEEDADKVHLVGRAVLQQTLDDLTVCHVAVGIVVILGFFQRQSGKGEHQQRCQNNSNNLFHSFFLNFLLQSFHICHLHLFISRCRQKITIMTFPYTKRYVDVNTKILFHKFSP